MRRSRCNALLLMVNDVDFSFKKNQNCRIKKGMDALFFFIFLFEKNTTKLKLKLNGPLRGEVTRIKGPLSFKTNNQKPTHQILLEHAISHCHNVSQNPNYKI